MLRARQTTMREVKESFDNVIRVYYCDLQYLLRGRDRVAYTAGVYGWNADVYDVGNGVAIVTGYRPFGDIHPPFSLVERYNSAARKACTDALDVLIWKFVMGAILSDAKKSMRFEVWEDNGGTVTLIIYGRASKPKYLRRYNGEGAGQCASDIKEYLLGNYPLDCWDGNELDELAERAGSLDALMAEYTERPGEIAQIAGPGWIDWGHMGAAARAEFGVGQRRSTTVFGIDFRMCID